MLSVGHQHHSCVFFSRNDLNDMVSFSSLQLVQHLLMPRQDLLIFFVQDFLRMDFSVQDDTEGVHNRPDWTYITLAEPI